MQSNADKAFEARLFLKCTGVRKEDHLPRAPAKQALLDELYVEQAARLGMLRISDKEYVCRELFRELLHKGTLPDNRWTQKSRIRFEKYL